MKHSTEVTRNRNKLLALAAAAIGLTLASGAVYGYWTQRWGPSVNLTASAEWMAKLPRELGEWRLLDEPPVSEAVTETLQCAGYVNRRYVHQRTGVQVNVALIVGPPGPTAVHKPEICFSSRAYEIAEPANTWRVQPPGGLTHSFRWLTFRSRNAGSEPLRVYYAWSRGEGWIASESPRFEFGGAPQLYKIQTWSEMNSDSSVQDESNDPCRSFLEALLQEFWDSAHA